MYTFIAVFVFEQEHESGDLTAILPHQKSPFWSRNSPQFKDWMDMEQNVEISPAEVGGSDSSNTSNSSLVSQAKKLLFRRMLVGIKDGRFFLGTFHCIDKQGNIILQDSVEYRNTRRSSPSPMEQRCLGLILIPLSCRTSCHVDCSIEEQLSLLKVQE